MNNIIEINNFDRAAPYQQQIADSFNMGLKRFEIEISSATTIKVNTSAFDDEQSFIILTYQGIFDKEWELPLCAARFVLQSETEENIGPGRINYRQLLKCYPTSDEIVPRFMINTDKWFWKKVSGFQIQNDKTQNLSYQTPNLLNKIISVTVDFDKKVIEAKKAGYYDWNVLE